MRNAAALFLGIGLVLSAGWWTGPVPADAPAALPKDFEATLRRLEKEIAEVRGLKFKSPVVAKIISRPRDAAKGIQGYYSIKDKAIVLYDDITGAYERGVLIHEMVHALQDQHFKLAKLHQGSFGSDAEHALAALIEGDATFTMIEVLKKDQPRVAAMLDVPLEKAKDVGRRLPLRPGCSLREGTEGTRRLGGSQPRLSLHAALDGVDLTSRGRLDDGPRSR